MRRQKFKRKDFQKNTGRKSLLARWANLEARRWVKCSNTKCDKDLKSGFLCLCVSGVLSVAYQTEKAVLQRFYFRLVKTYIHASSPWTNIKLPVHVIRHEFVPEVEFNRMAARNLSFIFPCFCLIKVYEPRYIAYLATSGSKR